MVKDIRQQNAERRLRHAVWDKPKCGLGQYAAIATAVACLTVAIGIIVF